MKNEQQNHIVSPVDIEDARNVLKNLIGLASAAIGLTRDRPEECASIENLEQRLQLMQYLVDRMGWVADVALRKLGDNGSLARPEDWMLPEV